MTLETRLGPTLEHESERVDVPPPDIEAIMARGAARASRHRALVTGYVAAAVLCVASSVAAAVTFRPSADSDPVSPTDVVQTVDDLAVGAAPALPHCVPGKGTVVDGKTVWHGCGTMVSRGGTTLVLTEQGTALVTRGGLIPLGRDTGGWVPAVSSDGDVAAFLTAGADGRQQLEVHEVRYPASVQLLARIPIDSNYAWVPGIDDQGRVYVWAFDAPAARPRMWAYDIGTGAFGRVTGLPAEITGPGPRYVTTDGVGFLQSTFADGNQTTDVTLAGSVDHRGRFVLSGELPLGWSNWTSDRRHLVQETAQGWWVQSPADLSHHVELQLPAHGRVVSLPVWESDDDLLVPFDPAGDPSVPAVNDPDDGTDVRTADLYVLRCAAADGRCEVASRPGQAPPDLRGPLYR